MREKDDTAAEPMERWLVTVRLETPGPRSRGQRGSSRRITRALSDAEGAMLIERLRAVAEGFLEEIGALRDLEEGWVEALPNGSWGWRNEG
jgi:hypothetical protein